MNRSKGSKSSRNSNNAPSSNGSKSVKNPGQNGGGGGASGGVGALPSTSANKPNDVSASTKKSKAKKSSKATAAASKQQTTSNASSLSSSKTSPSKAGFLSHHSLSSSSSSSGAGMNQSMTNKTKFPVPEPKKLERSHSFISRGFSKLYSSITGSRDGINKIPEDKEVPTGNPTSNASPEPPRFRRSLTLGSFSMKRRSMRESALEKLSEENELKHKEGDSNSTSPRDSQSITQAPSMTNISLRNVEWSPDENDSSSHSRRRMSYGQASLADMDKDAARYGSGLMSKLKRTFSITSEKRKQMNPVWSASLQNLQSIDNMVSYDDLSFIDYDKFNEIDKRIDQVLTGSQLHLNRMSTGSQPTPTPPPFKLPFQREMSVPTPDVRDDHQQIHHHPNSRLEYSPSTKSEQTEREVKRREHKFNTDHTKNLDEGKNLYRQSLDSQKLEFLNERNRESFRFSSSFEPKTTDYLFLDNCASVESSGRDRGDGESERTSWKSKEVVGEEQQQRIRRKRRSSEPILNGFTMERCSRLVSESFYGIQLCRPRPSSCGPYVFSSSLGKLSPLQRLVCFYYFLSVFWFVFIILSRKVLKKRLHFYRLDTQWRHNNRSTYKVDAAYFSFCPLGCSGSYSA